MSSNIRTSFMPQSHHTPGPRTRAVQGLFWTKIVPPRAGPVRVRCGAVRILPVELPINHPFMDRTGPIATPHDQIRRPCGILHFWHYHTPCSHVKVPFDARTGHIRHPYEIQIMHTIICKFPRVRVYPVRVPHETFENTIWWCCISGRKRP